jgi:hypothetical protein
VLLWLAWMRHTIGPPCQSHPNESRIQTSPPGGPGGDAGTAGAAGAAGFAGGATGGVGAGCGGTTGAAGATGWGTCAAGSPSGGGSSGFTVAPGTGSSGSVTSAGTGASSSDEPVSSPEMVKDGGAVGGPSAFTSAGKLTLTNAEQRTAMPDHMSFFTAAAFLLQSR